ncbi:MAG TPA: ankyrin repeat domain-containing protein [Thermoanaerobaculia bacterium]|nr:ankyrin repeat domain-containing protein [Thermoanaerobaculia bacterium]
MTLPSRQRAAAILRRALWAAALLACLGTPLDSQTKAKAQKERDGSALLAAIAAGQADRVKALIAAGADVNAKDAEGMTALVLAVFVDNASCLKALLAAHADVNAKEHLGNTALITAAHKGNTGFIKTLIAAGADVNTKNNDGYTALMYAQEMGSAMALIAARADVNAKDNNGGTALLGAALASDTGRVKVLIAAGANVNAKDNTGWAPLMGAANKGCADCIKALIAAGSGAVVNAQDVSGNTALMYAAQSGNLESVKALLSAGADVNAKNNQGVTALVAAKSVSVAALLRSVQSKGNSSTRPTAEPGGTHVVTIGGTGQASNADKEWDSIENTLAPGPLRAFLAKYPNYRGAEDKKLYLSLEEQMEQMRRQKSKPDFVMSFDSLPPQWSRWRKNYYYLSVISIGSDGSMGLAGGFSGRFDDNGNYTLPTKNGSIFIFEPKAANANWAAVGKVLFNGVTIQARGMAKLYFGVMEEHGIVHLRGGGTARMPDGKVLVLK